MIRFCIFRNQKKDTPLYSWFLFSCFSAHIPNQLWIALELKEAGSQPSLLPTVPQSRRWSAIIRVHISIPVILCHLLIPSIHIIILIMSASQVFFLDSFSTHGKWYLESGLLLRRPNSLHWNRPRRHRRKVRSPRAWRHNQKMDVWWREWLKATSSDRQKALTKYHWLVFFSLHPKWTSC